MTSFDFDRFHRHAKYGMIIVAVIFLGVPIYCVWFQEGLRDEDMERL